MMLEFRRWLESKADPSDLFKPPETGLYEPSSSRNISSIGVGSGTPGFSRDNTIINDIEDAERYYKTGYPRGHLFRGDPQIAKIQTNLRRMAKGEMFKSRDVRGMVGLSEKLPVLSPEFADLMVYVSRGDLAEPTRAQAQKMQAMLGSNKELPSIAQQLRIYNFVMRQAPERVS